MIIIPLGNFVIVILTAVVSSNVGGSYPEDAAIFKDEVTLVACEADLKAVSVVPPSRAPNNSRTSAMMPEGEVRVSLSVLPNGSVENVVIIGSTWTLRGKASAGPGKEYDQVIIDSVSGWKYPRRTEPCILETEMSFQNSRE